MGSLGLMNFFPPVFLTLQLLLLLNISQGHDFCSEGESGVEICDKDVSANSDFKIQEPHIFSLNSSNVTPYWVLPPESLTISTVSLRVGHSNKLRIRINISVNTTGLHKLRGFLVQGLELSNNKFHSFRIKKKKKSKIKDLWEVTYDCWIVTPGQEISVTLFSEPSYTLPVNKRCYISNQGEKPDFLYQHFEKERRFEISVPKGPDVFVRLCYMGFLCEDLKNSSKQLTNSSKIVSLSYEHLLPCLCIEAFYNYRDSKREKKCPFEKHPEPYIKELLNVSAQEVDYYPNTMTVKYNSDCHLMPTVTFCRKQKGRCITENKAVVQEHGKGYYLESVDRDPHLCFKFSLMNHTHIKCPNGSDRVWKVNVKTWLSQVLLTISSKIPASFSAALCHQNQETDDCNLKTIIYNVSMKDQVGSQDLQLSLPRPGFGDCIKVWRSDVRFSHPYFICSFDFSHKHLGLVALVSSLLIFTLIFIVYISCQKIWKILTASIWRRTILLVYSPDSAEYKTLICTFADFLHSILGCEVILDLWDMNTVSQIGMVPWFYQKRELVSQKKGKVMIIWTRQSTTMYDQWKNRQINSIGWKDSTNLFGAAMSCLEKDFEVQQKQESMENYTMVYFEGLCDKKDIPKCFRKISRYRLFKDMYRLVSHLKDTTCLSPPCLIKAVAKYLMKKLISSEKRQSLQHHIETCKKKLAEDAS